MTAPSAEGAFWEHVDLHGVFPLKKRMRLRTREGYPQSCVQRMTAPSAEGAKGNSASAEAAKGLCDRPLETFAPCGGDSWQVAAALSAAVTITKPIGERPHLTGGTK